MKFDDALVCVGGFGPYQKRRFALTSCLNAIEAYFIMFTIFAAREHKHNCRSDSSIVTHKYESNITVHSSTCFLHVINITANYSMAEKCSRWTYDMEAGHTITSEFDLVCEDSLFRTYVNMAVFGGQLSGMFFSSFAGDVFGRRVVLLVAIGIDSLSTAVCGLAPYYSVVVAMRFLNGLACDGEFESVYIINTEQVDPGHRRYVATFIMLAWCVGEAFLCSFAFFVRHWRYMMLTMTVPYVCMWFLVYFYITESPRWLLARGRKEKALDVLRKIASVNESKLPDTEINIATEKHSIKDVIPMFKNKMLTSRLVAIVFIWFVISFSYYGLTFNIERIGQNIYVDFLVGVIVEALGYACLMSVDITGRKRMNCFSLLLAGAACLSTIFTNIYATESLRWTTTLLAMIGKFGVCAAFANIFVYTAELFPTTVLSFVFSCSKFGARLGSIIGVYVADLDKFIESDKGEALPLIIFGVLFIVASFVSIRLPETTRCKLPENIDDVICATGTVTN